LALTDGLSEAMLRTVIKRLSITGRKRVEILGARHACKKALKRLGAARPLSNSELYSTLAPLPIEGILYMMAKTEDEDIKKSLSMYITRLRGIRPELKGTELKALGIQEGPEIGRVLTALLRRRLDGEIREKDEEIAFIKEYMKKGLKKGA